MRIHDRIEAAFETWGHFRLGPDFPGGREGLRNAVERAEVRGVVVGVHTLSNFITTNDPFVTPVPDPRLARVWTSATARRVVRAYWTRISPSLSASRSASSVAGRG